MLCKMDGPLGPPAARHGLAHNGRPLPATRLNAVLALSFASPVPRAGDHLLLRCLLLALLVHIWLALMIGTVPGTAEPGQSAWGSLNVTLRGPSGSATGSDAGAPAWRDDGPLGQAPSSRHGGRLRREPAPADSGPGAQELGRWKAQELPPDPSRAEEETAGARGEGALDLPAAPVVEPVPAPAAAALPEAVVRSLPREAVAAPTSPQLAAVEALKPSPTAELRPAPTLPEVAMPETVVRSLPLEAAVAPRNPQLQAIAAPKPAPAAELRPAPALPEIAPAEPVVRSLPREAAAAPRTPRLEALAAQKPSPAPASELRPAPALPEIAFPETTVRSLPREAAAAARAPRLEAVKAPQTSRAAVPELRPAPSLADIALPEPAAVPRTLAAPAAAARRQGTVDALDVPREPGRVERLAPLSPGGVARELPATESPAAASAATPMPNMAPATTLAPAPLTRGDPLAQPLPGPRASSGSPDAGARVGHDVATPPSASASAPLRPLNLSLPRSGPSAARRGPGVLELLPAPPERKSKLEQAVEEANREDCRKAHSDKGLLAAVPLAVDAVRGKGCKW
jgi:Meckel syndrome type 1 protein